MGVICVTATVRNPAEPKRCWEGEFLVDTDAMDTLVPRRHLSAIGIEPERQRVYRLADGSEVSMDIGVCVLEFMGELVGATVVFGDDGAEPVLGMTALESAGIEIDPGNQRLEKRPSVRLKALSDQERAERPSRHQAGRLQRREFLDLTFSQREDYEDLPQPLQLEELPRDARIMIWNVFYDYLHPYELNESEVLDTWRDVWRLHFVKPADQMPTSLEIIRSFVRRYVQIPSFNQVFDFIEYVMRHESCPDTFTDKMAQAFRASNLAYTIDTGKQPTILPAAAPAEGEALVESLHVIEISGLEASAVHLRNAVSHINDQKWADSIRESIHAVESTARSLAPESANSLGPALQSIDKHQRLHPALKGAFEKLYGYTSDEQGIRHPLIDGTEANVGRDEAIFMLGACASFASFLCRKCAPDSSP